MVLLIIIPMNNGYFIGNINPTFSDKAIWKWKKIVLVSIGIWPNKHQDCTDIHTEQHEDPQEPSGQSQDKGHA